MAAEYIPTVGNWSQRDVYGGISPNYTVYTFKIRPNLKAANGDPITAYDVWYSITRGMLCAGGIPSTGGWLITQYLIPNYIPYTSVVKAPNDTLAAEEIISAVTYDNATNTVTFHLIEPVSPTLFFMALSHTLGGGAVLDAKWLESVGDGINLTGLYSNNLTQLAESFYSYEQTCNAGNYNLQVQNNPMSTGPYMIASYTPGQSVVLKPNPYWPSNVSDIPKPNDTVIIYWVKDPDTAYEMFSSGQADIVVGLPSNYIPLLENMESNGQANLYTFPTTAEFFFVFTLNTNTQLLKQINPSYSIPSYYFANPLVRKAFAYAFNYSEYINDIVGNAKYHFDFGSLYCGAIVKGLNIYIPESNLTGCPTYNLTYAKQLMEESGFYNITVNFPIIVSSGDTVDFTAAEMWAQALNEIDPNINAQPLYEPFSTIISYMIPGENPMALYYLGWISGYPTASFAADSIYLASGAYPSPDGWNITYLNNLSAYFNKTGNTNVGAMIWQEAQEFQEMNNVLQEADEADLAGNVTQAISLYKQAEQMAINLYMYVYTIQQNAYWAIKPYMQAYQGNILAWEENPSFNGAGDSWYFWWYK
ncbi:ABC transporter substrate-binding protein [Caldisphaera sp.]|uniref:ABC transporter substrate-binding protein n=1 Tax=Caldisphaera sp. TaxID=2060322 RepID=UPI00397A93CF